MKLFRFDRGVAQPIGQYGSRELMMARVLRAEGSVRVDVMHIGPGGLVGGHNATGNQIFAVVEGNGWTSVAPGIRVPLTAGQAAFWTAGEWHESGSATGMTVIVIEGADIDPEGVMAPLEEGR